MKQILNLLALSVITLSCVALSACGGGGGGGGGGDEEFSGPASAELLVTPTTVYIGDRVQVKARLWNVAESGVVIKYRFPEALSYARLTAKLITGGYTVELTPTNYEKSSGVAYLVFVLHQTSFGSDAEGTIIFELEALSAIDKAPIELDPSIRDTSLSDNNQFSISTPRFGTDIKAEIRIKA